MIASCCWQVTVFHCSISMEPKSVTTMDLSENEETILEATLSLHPKSNYFLVSVSKAHVTLKPVKASHRQHDSFMDDGKSINRIHLADVIGCDCAKGRKESDCQAYLSVYAYPHVKKFASKKTARKRQVTTFVFGAGKDFQENYSTALHWKAVLCNLIQNNEITKSEALLPSLKPPAALNFLVLVNPFSGPGNALQIFQQRIVPILAEAGIHYHLWITEYAGHAKEITRTLKLDDWSGILIVSGDGLIFEVINGLMARNDWEKAIKLPIGALPGGSGNALCCSLLYRANEPYLENCVLHASFTIAKHRISPMDLVAVDLSSGERLYSFLSVGWGIIADADIESEKFRSLGNARFTIGAVIRILDLRKYRGRLSYLPADGASCLIKRSDSYDNRGLHVTSDHQKNQSCEHSTLTSIIDPRAAQLNEKDAKIKDETKKQNSDCKDSIAEKPILKDESATAGQNPGGVNLANDAQKVEASLLVPLKDPVPATWTTIEDDFVVLVALYQTHIAQDLVAAPHSKLDDGLIHLIFMRGNVSRVRLIKLFNAMQSGEPFPDDPLIDSIKVHAFRLEPLTPNGTLTVDGEIVSYGPIQAQVLPSLARVMTLRVKG